MKLNRLAQSTLQYIVIAALVSAGILIGGPYVIRSWNANMKTFEDSATDSFDDIQEQATPFNYDVPCECGPFQGTAPGTCAQGICGSYEFREARVCKPLGCVPDDGLPSERCTQSPTCCTEWAPLGCGHLALPPSAIADGETPCQTGERGYIRTCGDESTFEYDCVPDDACIFECVGVDRGAPPPDPWAHDWCPGAHEDLVATTPVLYRNHGECSIDETLNRCAADCIGNALPGGIGCECVDSAYADQHDFNESETVLTYESPQFNEPIDISVKLTAEDLIFDIKYFGAAGNEIKNIHCLRDTSVPYVPECFDADPGGCYDANPDAVRISNVETEGGVLTDSCGYIDGQLDEDVYVAPIVSAYRVEVWLSDTDPSLADDIEQGLATISYEVGLGGNCCKYSNRVGQMDPKYQPGGVYYDTFAMHNLREWFKLKQDEGYISTSGSLPADFRNIHFDIDSATRTQLCEIMGYDNYVQGSAVEENPDSTGSVIATWDGTSSIWQIRNATTDDRYTFTFDCQREIPSPATYHNVMLCDDDAWGGENKYPDLASNPNYDFSTGTHCAIPGDNQGIICDTDGNTISGPGGGSFYFCPEYNDPIDVKAGDIIIADSGWGHEYKGEVVFLPEASCPDLDAPVKVPFLNEVPTYIDLPCDGQIVNHMRYDNITTTVIRPAGKCSSSGESPIL